jgi:ubiquitin carboxyl-terminal hydrolase 4/11/15
MNSALQCLSHVIPLTNFFLDGLTRGISDDDKDIDPEWNQFYTVGPVTGAYTDVLRNLWLPNKTAYYISSFRPTHIKETVGLKAPRFATWDQQDAQEFMTFLLDEIHKELKEKNGSESNNIIEELFFGKIQSTITCLECKHEVKTINPISFLPLPLTQPGRLFVIKFIGKNGDNDCATVSVPENGQVKSLIQAFVESRPSHSFFRTIIAMTDDGQLDLEMPLNKLSIPEVILVEEDDFASSTPYNRFNRSSKQLTLEGCLREFCSLESLEDSWLCEQETCKKHTKATKQLQFYSLPPILIIQFKRFSHKDGLREKIETFVDYPIDGLDLSSFLSSGEEAVYDLFAVIMHTGSIYDGHYISFARHETNGRSSWYKFDDAYVTSVYYKEEIVSRNAYLLFYIKRDKSKQSTTTMSS